MSKTRYKIRKEQLERVVESFVMESAEGKMMVSDAAKKHKMNMGAEQNDDMGDGMKKAPVAKKNKMKQAPEVKKNIHGKISESDKKMIKLVSEKYNISESTVIREMELIKEFDENTFMTNFKAFVSRAKSKGFINDMPEEEMMSIEKQARMDNFEGSIKLGKKEGEYYVYYEPTGELSGASAKLPWWKRMGKGTGKST